VQFDYILYLLILNSNFNFFSYFQATSQTNLFASSKLAKVEKQLQVSTYNSIKIESYNQPPQIRNKQINSKTNKNTSLLPTFIARSKPHYFSDGTNNLNSPEMNEKSIMFFLLVSIHIP
jgi:spore germination protein GerM